MYFDYSVKKGVKVMAYDSYKTYRTVSSSNPRNQMLLDKLEQVKYLYDLAADREDGCLLNDVEFIQSPRVFGRKTSSLAIQTVTVETVLESDKFIVGDYLQYDSEVWICESSFVFHGLYCKGDFTKCNFVIKYQNEARTTLSFPCITRAKSSGIGLDEGKIITNPDAVREVILPLNENTVLLRNDKRFFLDKHPTSPTPFIITDVDTTSREGLVVLTVQKDELKDSTIDRVDLGICDYKDPIVIPEPPENEGYAKITSSSGETIIIGLSTGTTLSPTFYNSDSTINNTIVAIWDYVKPSGLESFITISNTGNLLKIVASDEFSLFGSSITVNVSDGNNGYNGTITLVFGGW
jgi:hypothetical protein